MFLTFKMSFDVDILACFCLATVWATFQNIWKFFQPSSLSPCFVLECKVEDIESWMLMFNG
jgi:hypothetical protein